MKCKIDLSWVKGKAREVIFEAIMDKLEERRIEGIPYEDTIQYLYVQSIGTVWGEERQTFNNCVFTEVSVNDALNGKFPSETPKKVTFRCGQEVLVRDLNYESWCMAFFSHIGSTFIPYVTYGGNAYAQCISYEGNEKLLGTTRGL